MAIIIYFNDRDLLLGTSCILHLIVNGAEESEGRERRGGITRPFLLGIWGGLGSKRGSKIPALLRASRLGLPCQQVNHRCVRAEENLSHLSVFVAAAQPADGGVLQGSAFVFSSQLMSHQQWGDLGGPWSVPRARSPNVSISRAGFFHVLNWAKIFWACFTRVLKGWNF